MEDFFIRAVQFILSLSILVVLHELGHFIPAKLFKTKVEKFYLFFDVKFSLLKKKIGETTYGIGWLPLGGYVKIAGMIDESMDTQQMESKPQPWEFRSKPAWQRLIIMAGGVIVNVIVGFVIYAMILFTWGKEEVQVHNIPNGYSVSKVMQSYGFENGDIPVEVNGEKLPNTLNINRMLLVRNVNNIKVKRQNGNFLTLSVPDSIGNELFRNEQFIAFSPRIEPLVDVVLTNSPAEKAGILSGDKIIAINEKSISFSDEIQLEDKEVLVTILRNSEEKTITLTPENQKMGVSFSSPKIETTKITYSFAESIPAGISHGYYTLRDYAVQMKYIFTKKGVSQVGGFGAMAKMFPTEWNWQRFWEITAMISIILAFMNILPIPALDGGHIVFLLYEMVTRRKPNQKVLEHAQVIGMLLLLGIFLFANLKDVFRWVESFI